MPSWMETVSIVDGPLFSGVFAVAGTLLLVLLSPAPWQLRPLRRHVLVAAIAALTGGAVGALATWLLGDVLNIFGISLTWVVRWANALAGAAAGIAIAALVRTRWPRKVLAVLTLVVTALGLGMVINVDFGQYPRLGDALGTTYTAAADLPPRVEAAPPVEQWTPPQDLPDRGHVGRVTIPATVSGFPARPAYVYLPPAALAEEPPALPVVVALAGQPGEPADMFRAAGIDTILDDLAEEHEGLAPIVVVPDQLGNPTENPMCVDGELGNSATYLTVDVPAWIRARLNVSADRTDWTIAGFSQGGTCSLQLGAGHPELFGALLDIAGEEAPTLGSPEATVDRGFGGDAEAYRAATPAALLEAGAPYRDTVAVFVAGENDRKYSASMRTVSAQAAEAGMAVTVLVSPRTAHDWNTARFGLREGFERLLPRWGIG
ncbi:esterase family protein [Naasia sp. SYSU D00948]|uniref:alpha/beta hydrolase n=1 Tax=Naasia sp. SYSU D00948 TaxID=2817379 RepID=UPI001B314B6A|nr:alpha/beta hydrolase-fold protein [Naasia sp. SYSU D00948]